MSGAAALRVKHALKRPRCETAQVYVQPQPHEKRWCLELDDDSHAQFLALFERYKDIPHLRDTVFGKYGNNIADIPAGANIYPMLMLLKKHEKEQLERDVTFETYRAIALKQDLVAKDAIIAHHIAQYEALLGIHAGFAKVHDENETLKAALFQAKRETAALQHRLDTNTSLLTGAFQARIHAVREQSTQLINDEYLKLTHHIRGELRIMPDKSTTLLDGITEHVDNIRLAVGRSLI